jgi:hypothetical protein
MAPSDSGSPITSYVIQPFLSGQNQAPQTFNSAATTEIVTGLTNGQSYTFAVTAINAVGSGVASMPSSAVEIGLPSVPTGVTAVAGNGQATISWTAPTPNGVTITGYAVNTYMGGALQSSQVFNSTATTETANGLEGGTTYTFTVQAASATGFSPESAPSNAVATPPTAPGPPELVTASPGNAEATVSWSAPLTNGAPITGYVVTPYIAGVAQAPQTFNTTATTNTLSGLSNGTSYTFTVAGVNAIGEGTQSFATTAVTVGAPIAPTAVTATSGTAQATVSWMAPSDNGFPITGYVIALYQLGTGGGEQFLTSLTFNSPATTETVFGLTSGSTYRFAVAGVNGEGQGPDSALSNAVTIQ